MRGRDSAESISPWNGNENEEYGKNETVDAVGDFYRDRN